MSTHKSKVERKKFRKVILQLSSFRTPKSGVLPNLINDCVKEAKMVEGDKLTYYFEVIVPPVILAAKKRFGKRFNRRRYRKFRKDCKY